MLLPCSLTKVTGLFSDTPKYEALYKSEKDDYNIVEVVNKEGPAQVFVSERSGSSQLWLSQNGLIKQLSHFTHDGSSTFAMGGLSVSPNQQRILLRINKSIAFYDVIAEKLYSIAEFKGRKIVSYVWSKNNEGILYIEQGDSKNILAKLNLLTRDTTLLDDIKPNKLISDSDYQ